MYGIGRFVVIALAAAVLGVAGWQYAAHWRPSPETYSVQGVDVSEANGAIEWPVVAGGGADFAYAVATNGTVQRDRQFEANWQGIAAAGMRRGAVHVWSMCQSAVAQANAFNTVVPRDDEALPAAIDIDVVEGCDAQPERQQLVDAIRQAASMIEAHTGKPVMLRVSRTVERRYDLMSAIPRPLWAKGNFFAPDYASRPWRMWRASDRRRIDGVDGTINWDVAAP